MIKTTVCVMDSTVSKIKNLKIHKRQSSEDIILSLIQFYNNNSTLDDGTIGYQLKRGEANE